MRERRRISNIEHAKGLRLFCDGGAFCISPWVPIFSALSKARNNLFAFVKGVSRAAQGTKISGVTPSFPFDPSFRNPGNPAFSPARGNA